MIIVAHLIVWIIFFGLILVIITVASNAWWRVPYVPTHMKIVRSMVEKAKLKSGQTVYDLGAGDARFLVEAKKQVPGIQAIGYEVALGVWMLGKLRILLSGKKVRLYWRSFMKADLSDADVIFLYLIPYLMPLLCEKLKRELKPGTKVLSNAFQFKDRKPVETFRVKLPLWGEKPVYVYEW